MLQVIEQLAPLAMQHVILTWEQGHVSSLLAVSRDRAASSMHCKRRQYPLL